MSDQRFTKLENQLERLIEGAFAQMFSRSIRAHDIALHLSRAMEGGAMPGTVEDVRPVAPDRYTVRMNPKVYDHLIKKQSDLASILTQHLVGLAQAANYRLIHTPYVFISGDEQLTPSELEIESGHSLRHDGTTVHMGPLDPLPAIERPPNPQLMIGERTVDLTDEIVNMGRSRTNHIVIDDPYLSRHHAQLRLRAGAYTLFDTNSQGGTFVNNTRVREHRLQPGDVIRIGKTQLVYVEDDRATDARIGATAPFEP